MNLKQLGIALLAALAMNAALAASASVETLPSGVSIVHAEPVKGQKVAEDDVIRLYYDGHSADGKLFSSWWTDKSAPAQFKFAYTQPCFAQALSHLQVGESAELHCPASTVIGAGGVDQPDTARQDVTFKVRVVSIEAPQQLK